jgi:hypothetical protein
MAHEPIHVRLLGLIFRLNTFTNYKVGTYAKLIHELVQN